jgi:hypothetical protein
MTESALRQVCVFCGSSPGARSEYADAARALGAELAHRDIRLVYGGGRVGLMGMVADAVLAAGGAVTGVIPRNLAEREVAHERLTELVVVDTLFERKDRMLRDADAFVALPGGVGTLDELFEVLTWSQLGVLPKACGLLDVAGFWRGLETFLDSLVTQRFLRAEHRELLLRDDAPGPLLDRLAAWEPSAVEKWIDRESES